jgi:hypothetical protein
MTPMPDLLENWLSGSKISFMSSYIFINFPDIVEILFALVVVIVQCLQAMMIYLC